MARPMVRRKQRSSVPKKRQKAKSKKQLLNNPIIAANWNSSETPAQNYRRLGLVSKLNKSSGGKEAERATLSTSEAVAIPKDDPLAINPTQKAAKNATEEITIERDPETGAILRVVDAVDDNPLNDQLNQLGDGEMIDFNVFGKVPKRDPKLDKNTDVTRQLEEYAASGVASRPRQQSTREEEWIAQLVEKHGDDYRAMFWDRKLNIMQQSEGDLKRRIKKWKAKHG